MLGGNGQGTFGDLSGARGVVGGSAGPYYSVRITSASTVTPPSPKYRLCEIMVEGGTTPGALQILYNGSETAVFPSPCNGTRGYATYWVDYAQGQQLSSGQLTFSTGIAAVTLKFKADSSDGGPSISTYRALYFTAAPAGATATATAFTAQNFAGAAGNHPKSYVVYVSAGNAQVQMPIVDGVTDEYSTLPVDFSLPVLPCPKITDNTAFTPTYTGSAAQTISAAFYY
jgi:hypothetical protein